MSHTYESDESSLVDQFLQLFKARANPFEFQSLTFGDLPKRVQRFLLRNGFVLPKTDPKAFSAADLDEFFKKILEVRQAELLVFERNTTGVHREMALQIFALTPRAPGAPRTAEDREVILKFHKVLLPEWFGHLNDALEKIDALLWFEMELTKGTCFGRRTVESYQDERAVDMKLMVKCAVQCLQRAKEQIERETIPDSDSEHLFSETETLHSETDSDYGASCKDLIL